MSDLEQDSKKYPFGMKYTEFLDFLKGELLEPLEKEEVALQELQFGHSFVIDDFQMRTITIKYAKRV